MRRHLSWKAVVSIFIITAAKTGTRVAVMDFSAKENSYRRTQISRDVLGRLSRNKKYCASPISPPIESKNRAWGKHTRGFRSFPAEVIIIPRIPATLGREFIALNARWVNPLIIAFDLSVHPKLQLR